MSRYRRVNIDGKSLFKTETRVTAAALLPGTFALIDGDDKFAAAPAGVLGRIYVIDAAHHQGLGIRDEIPKGDSAIGNYVEEGRELAILCGPGTYTKDDPITVGSDGMGAIGATHAVGWCQDEVTIAGGDTDFIRVRMRTTLDVAAVETVTVSPAEGSIDLDTVETIQLTATVLPINAPQAVVWSTANAQVATVDMNGLVTPTGKGGPIDITATSVANSNKSDAASITVTGA